MPRKRNGRSSNKISFIFVLIILFTSIAGLSFGHWQEQTTVDGTITTGTWVDIEEIEESVKVRKILYGVYTNPWTGETEKEGQIGTDLEFNPIYVPYKEHIAVAAPFPTMFKLVIEIENSGDYSLYNIWIQDKLPNEISRNRRYYVEGEEEGERTFVPPIPSTISSYHSWDPPAPSDSFIKDRLTWYISELPAGTTAIYTIYLETTKNPSQKYEPTSGDQTITVNDGVEMTAEIEIEGETLSIYAKTGSLEIKAKDPVDYNPPHKVSTLIDPYPSMQYLDFTEVHIDIIDENGILVME